MQVKPTASLSGAKRKVVSPAKESRNAEGKEEWSCVICQVSTNSKRVLKDHFQGKKHKSKEAALRAEMKGCNIGIGVLPKNVVKPIIGDTHVLSPPLVEGEALQINHTVLSSPQVPKLGGEVLQINQSEPSSSHAVSTKCLDENSMINHSVLSSPQVLKLGGEVLQINQSEPSSLHAVSTKCLDENSMLILLENEKKDKLKNKKLVGVQKAPKSELKEKKNFTFWCDMCQVGASCEIVMESHRKGKKHLKLLKKVRENGKLVGVQKAPKSKPKEKENFTFWCDMCQVGSTCEMVMEGHRKGKKHLKLLKKARENGQANLTSQIVDIQGANGSNETPKGGDNKAFENVGRTSTKVQNNYVKGN